MDSPASIAAKQLAWDLESRKSVEVRVTTGITNHVGGAGNMVFDTVDEHYIETAAGQRFSDYRAVTKEGKVISRTTHFGNGLKFADVNYQRKSPDVQAVIYINRHYWMEDKSDRRQLPQPLLFLYVGREPLHEALSRAEYLGKGEVLGRECHRFLFSNVRWTPPQDQIYYLDKATSIPLKVESFPDKAARERNEPLGVWEAKTLDQVQGHYTTLKSSQTAFGKDGKPSFTWDFTVQSMAFDKDYPTSTFWPVLQPGVAVFDATTNKTYEVPGGKKPVPQEKAETAAPVQPVQATPPRDWSSLASSASLGLGCAFLLFGAFAWWRRR